MKLFKQQDIYKSIGNKFRILRDDKGLTLEQLSQKIYKEYKLDISANMLGKIERGSSRIPLDQFLVFCRFYKIDLSFFFPDEEIYKLPARFEDLIHHNEGRECLKYIAQYSDRPDYLYLIFQFIHSVLPAVDRIQLKKTKETSLLKASSPAKK